MKGNKIRQITDGSIIVAIYGMIFLISRFTGGQVEYSFSFLLPLPLAIYAYKYDFRKSLIPYVATVIISLFLSGNPFSGLFVVLPISLSGCLLGGILVKKKIKPIYSILVMAIFSALVEVLSTVAFSSLLGMENIFADIENIIRDFGKIIPINDRDFPIIQALMEGIIPSLILIVSLLSSLTSYLLFVVLIRRIFKEEFNKEILHFFSLDNLLPKSFAILYCLIVIASVCGLIFFKGSQGILRILIIVLINISFVVGTIYFYFGLKVMALLIKITNRRWLLIIEFVLLIFVPWLFVIFGIFDNFFNLQTKIYNKRTNNR